MGPGVAEHGPDELDVGALAHEGRGDEVHVLRHAEVHDVRDVLPFNFQHHNFQHQGRGESAGGQRGTAHLTQAQTGTVPSRLEGIAVRSRDVCVFVYLLGEGGQLDDGAGQVHVLALTDHGRVHHLGCSVAQPSIATVSSGDFSASRPLSALGGR